MAKQIRWGILGCGRIANKFANDLFLAGGGRLVALASRSLDNAQDFANRFPADHVHGSYEALVNNPEVDIIYIATPHGLHHEHTLLCLNHKKAVLCEKAFAINSRQVESMIDTARKNNTFLMEAMWTKFVPHYLTTMNMIREGKLGEIWSVTSDFGFATDPSFPQRLFDPAMGGGTLLDIGIYNVFITLSVLGVPDEIEASMTTTPKGIDDQMAVSFRYKNGACAQLLSSFKSNMATEANINGDRGRIKLTSRFYEPISTSIEFYPGKADSRQMIPFEKEDGFGYQYQIRHAQECLRKGLTESPVMSLSDSLGLMNTMDAIRKKAGLHYDADQ